MSPIAIVVAVNQQLGDEHRIRLISLLWAFGRRGPVPIPKDPARCNQLLEKFKEFIIQTEEEFISPAAQRTASEKIQAKVVSLLNHKLAAL